MTFNVNADYFRAAALVQSTEQTRYYLCGVHIEPHAVKGVLLVATDGHRMVAIHDEEGSTDGSYIVALDKDALKATKQGRGERAARRVVGEETGEVWVRDSEGGKLTFVKEPIVDGTFPDWRRVLPGGAAAAPTDAKLDWFSADYLGAFGKVVEALDGHSAHMIRVEQGHNGGPALVRFGGLEHAFGVLMPVRGVEFERGVPAFVNARPELAQAA